VIDDRLKIAVGEAAGLGSETERSLDLVRIPAAPDATARMSQRSAPDPSDRNAASSGLAGLG
jgi:hypothetical protein